MTTTKTILIAAGGAAVTFALIWLGATGHLGGEPQGDFQGRLAMLLLPAEIIGDVFGTTTSFIIAGFLEFFSLYWLGLFSWSRRQARKRA
jgi:hypothetical protein